MARKLDDINRKILTLLQKDGRMKRQDVAKEVGLSTPAVSERMNKLLERGIIERYTAVVNPEAVNKGITAYITMGIENGTVSKDLEKKVANTADILESHVITGVASHLLKVRVSSISSLNDLINEIKSWKSVNSVESNVVLSTMKETNILDTESTED
ncbi:MAG: Lrp/AsnC family transcriptional regulator [Candidatus Marinimicrobia bacterium]|nr:Lrp/AsnC family transcriptional regulator [Candidatus Neomarinimicrobiota bacterium]MCF7828976.1 Lrp/AsnC family transcriptional regulator [Candidatus Neomarinimicrobiota bacterium]MCF7879936.1 Lrp/AsnC family transcriptional regulator [Candidatus Neomarinimicrobiota bacterium]